MTSSSPHQAPMSANPSGAIHPTRFLLGWGVATVLLTRFAPLPIPELPEVPLRIVTVILTALGVGGLIWSQWSFWRVGTTAEHSEETRALVTNGPFRVSRNPIYVSLILIFAGLGLHYETVWALVLTIPVAWALHRWTVKPEERYLQKRFGDEYQAYRERVRRWL